LTVLVVLAKKSTAGIGGARSVAERSGAMEGLGPRNPGKPFAKKSAARRKFRT